jgi:hypothetical protein
MLPSSKVGAENRRSNSSRSSQMPFASIEQDLLILAHPEAKELIAEAKPEKRPKLSPSWQRFIENRELLARYNVTNHELRALENLSFLGTVSSAKEFLAILTLIRDIRPNK